jgi:hypothetical protein
VSYETDRDHDLAPRRMAKYRCDNGEVFDIPFADDAEIPGTWLCRNGLEGTLVEGTAPEAKKVKPPRTHWDMLLERRSKEELEELLKERLDLLKAKRRGALHRQPNRTNAVSALPGRRSPRPGGLRPRLRRGPGGLRPRLRRGRDVRHGQASVGHWAGHRLDRTHPSTPIC